MRRVEVRGRAAGARKGFALIEAMIALTILAGAVLSAGRYFTQLARGVSDERTRAQAMHLVGERFEQVKTSPTYAKIDSLYAGVESNITGYAGYTRLTEILRVGGQPADTRGLQDHHRHGDHAGDPEERDAW